MAFGVVQRESDCMLWPFEQCDGKFEIMASFRGLWR